MDTLSSGKQYSSIASWINERMATYYINLERCPDRRLHMDAMLAAQGLKFRRVPAIDGSQLKLPVAGFDEQGYKLRHGRKPNPFEIGCYLSHLACARELLETQKAYALILEDDLAFPADILELLSAALEDASSWDILRLSTVNKGRKYIVKRLTAARGLAVSLTREKGSGAYIINRRAAAWITEQLNPMRLPYDLAFDLEHFAGLKALFVAPVPVLQTADRHSFIQNGLRQYRLPHRQRMMVMPYRFWYETTRFLARLGDLTTWKAGIH
ncbi:glycosyl transferase [Rhizobium sp. AC44/96]|uniref:glycosyltransferase family 25 protein n=1 Tax=Rhizobium sp. AC44/96 TaxID=1841654 RepID=UPI00080F951D|nr:glycosyltransferase family 25 protein [Rhizobium sp. AC44/96]OCJ02708.1 glycosyl transferase [Rhizobium sp. AC44/96]